MNAPKLWGGVFSKGPDHLAWEFGKSLESDLNLLDEEIQVSVAHAKMLANCGIISREDGVLLVNGLDKIALALRGGSIALPENAEDIHGAIEWLLQEQIGEVAKRLHAGRSRNDQVTTITRLWLKRKSAEIQHSLTSFQDVLLNLAELHIDRPMPGMTHQQPAQPITVGFWLMAYFWMLERDGKRFANVNQMADQCPLGAAALAGTSLPIDRSFTSDALGFSEPTANALDSVSDRDFIGDALHACATLMQHLSRLSQEIVLYSTAEFGYLQLDDALSTGSSVMPQKRNPDFAELIRGRSSRAIGNWTTFMSMMRGLPLGYNRDQQDDKPPLFDSVRLCQDALELAKSMVSTATFQFDRMEQMSGAGFSTATGLAEALVKQGVPFRTAHETVGVLVKICLSKGIDLSQLAPEDIPLENANQLVDSLKQTTVRGSIESRNSQGGPSASALQLQLEKAKTLLNSKL